MGKLEAFYSTSEDRDSRIQLALLDLALIDRKSELMADAPHAQSNWDKPSMSKHRRIWSQLNYLVAIAAAMCGWLSLIGWVAVRLI